jgi:hypothetical protein
MNERRTTIYLIGLALLALFLVLTGYLAKAYWGGAVGEDAWVTQNELALADVPVYPGAVESQTPYSTGEPDPEATTRTENGGPFRGYWTTHVYALPSGAGPDLVLDFYRQHLVGWDPETVQGSSCEAAFRRERSMLDVKACGGSLELDLNYREYGG